MSEEILEKAAVDGVFASGGIGGVTDPAAGDLGNVPGGLFGITTGPNAVNPHGAPEGGILGPIQAQTFIDYVWDATYLAKDGRRKTMRANTEEIEKINVGERVIRAAAQADATHTNAGATFAKVELTTKKIRLDWELSTESLEDNIEGAALEDHIVRLMTNALANDLEDLAINGDGTTGDFLSIMGGFVHQADSSGDAHEAVVDLTDGWKPEELQKIINTMPRKYRALKNGLKFYGNTETFNNVVQKNGTLASAIFTEGRRDTYLGGTGQTIGGLKTTQALGVQFAEVPYFPADRVELTFPANRVWGFQRNIVVYRDFVPKKDTVEYTVYVRFGVTWEELDALAFAEGSLGSS